MTAYTRNRDTRKAARIYYKTNSLPTELVQIAQPVKRTFIGNTLPKFREKIANHENATTQYSGDFSSIDSKKGYLNVLYRFPSTGKLERRMLEGDSALFSQTEPTWSGGWASNAEPRAASNFLQDVRKAQVQWSGPTFLGELRETVRMFTHPLSALEQSITRYLKAVKELNRENRRRYFNKKPKKYARELGHIASGLWLEYAFGWVPFLHDLDDSRDAYNSLFDKEHVTAITGAGKDFKQVDITRSYTGVAPGFTTLWAETRVRRETDIVRYRGAVLHRAATTAQERFARYGFTPSEFIPTAWELLPWSFLIDYFANIGDLINASVTSTADVAWCARTQLQIAEVETTQRCDTGSKCQESWAGWDIKEFTSSPSTSKWTRRLIARAASAVPYPRLYLSYPRSPRRLLNVSSLMYTVGIETHPQEPSRRNYRL